MVSRTMAKELDELTAQDLRERGSLKWSRFGGDTIGAFVTEMDFGTAPAITRALRGAVEAETFGFLSPRLTADVARETARWHRHRNGWEIAPEQVRLVDEVLTGLELAMRHFTAPGSAVIVPTPAYPPFLTVPPLHGREVIQVPMHRDGGRYVLDLAGIDRAFADGAGLLVLSNPANPVGRVFTVDELAAVGEVVERHSGRVFADESHSPLIYPEHRYTPYASVSTASGAHTLTATSAEEAWNLSGLKCAQVILTNPADADTWQRVGSAPSASASTLGAVATAAAYRAGAPWLREVLAYLDHNRRRLRDMLPEEVGYSPPEGTYLAWLDTRGLGIGDAPGEFLRERAGVAVVDGAECGEVGRGYVRLTLAMPRPILERAVTRSTHAVGRRK
jgi:cysteine-S-conjugate beta-lyase